MDDYTLKELTASYETCERCDICIPEDILHIIRLDFQLERNQIMIYDTCPSAFQLFQELI